MSMSMPTAAEITSPRAGVSAQQHPARVPAALDTPQTVMSELDAEIDKLREHISPALRPAEPTPGPSAPLEAPPSNGSDLANRVDEMARHANAMTSRLYSTRARIDL